MYPVCSGSRASSGSTPPSVQPSVQPSVGQIGSSPSGFVQGGSGQIGSVRPASLQPGGRAGAGAAGTVENGQSGCASGAVKREEDTAALSSIQSTSAAVAAVPVDQRQTGCSADNGRDSVVFKREEEVPALPMQSSSSAVSVEQTTSSGIASDCAPVAVKSEEEKIRPIVRLPPVDQMLGLSLSSLPGSGSSLCFAERNGERIEVSTLFAGRWTFWVDWLI